MVFKVVQSNAKPIEEKKPKRPKICLCKALNPTFVLMRILGLFPIISTHKEDGTCEYKTSTKLLIYSLILYVLTATRIFFTTKISDIFNIHQGNSIHATLNALSDILYGVFTVLLIIINLLRRSRFVAILNKMVSMKDEGLLCESSLKGIMKVQYVTLLIFFILLTLEYGLVISLNISESYQTDQFDYKFFLNRLTPNLLFFVYIIFISLSSVIVGMLGCYQKIASASLKFEQANPLKDIDYSTNKAEFLAVFRYKICEKTHEAPAKTKILTQQEIIENLRCFHENISLIAYDINECFDPQFLLHVMIELTILIIHWYAVILYIAYTFTSETARTLNVLNIMFALIHTLGVLTFLKHAQQLQNMVKNLTDFLLEFSTKITCSEEHQQLRIFIHKLKTHRPLTASGVFNIDLSIAGPIFANILTYVLVALQFDVPKN